MAAAHLNEIARRAALAGLLALTTALAACNRGVETVTVRGETFTVELAVSEEEITRGMGGRESFPDGGGMLFVFPQAQVRSFWMYDCLIDIDLLFLNSMGVVVALHRMKAEPLRGEDESESDYRDRLKNYWSNYPAQFALEVEAGTIDRLGVQVDDRVEMDLQGLKAKAR